MTAGAARGCTSETDARRSRLEGERRIRRKTTLCVRRLAVAQHLQIHLARRELLGALELVGTPSHPVWQTRARTPDCGVLTRGEGISRVS